MRQHAAGTSERRRDQQGPASSTSGWRRRGTATRSPSILRGGGHVRRRLGPQTKETRSSRDGLCNTDGPIVVSAARKRRSGRLGRAPCSSSRARVEREYYYNDRRGPDGALPRLGRGRRRGEEPPRGTASRRVHRGAGAECRRPGAGDADTGSRRRWSASGSTSTPGMLQSELEKRLPEYLPRLDTYEKDGLSGRGQSAHGRRRRPGPDPLRRRGTPTYRRRRTSVSPRRYKLAVASTRCIDVLRCRPPRNADNWYAAVARMLGHDPPPSRFCLPAPST
jgi:hypothetical protein